jgi:hypothetical protein
MELNLSIKSGPLTVGFKEKKNILTETPTTNKFICKLFVSLSKNVGERKEKHCNN